MADDGMTDRQREIKQLLDRGKQAREIGVEMGISRNAVYQQIQRMRRNGVLPSSYTPSGVAPRDTRPGEDMLRRLVPSLDGDEDPEAQAGVAAILLEVRRTRDELDAIAQRLSYLVPRTRK